MDKWTPATEGTGFEFTETLKPLEKLRDRAHRRQQPRASAGRRQRLRRRRRPRAFGAGVPERRAAREGRRPRGTHDRPGARRAHRAGHAAAVDRAGLEEVALNCGAGLRLRVLNTISWRTPTAAAADGEQPAGGLRAAVRRRHQRGAAPVAKAAGPQHSRRGHGQGRRGFRAGSIRATARGSASISTTSARSNAASRRRSSNRPATRTCPRPRSACRKPSRITSS